MTESVYGYCPQCGAKGAARERRKNGNDTCVNNHTYPSATAIPDVADAMKITVYDALHEVNRRWGLATAALRQLSPISAESVEWNNGRVGGELKWTGSDIVLRVSLQHDWRPILECKMEYRISCLHLYAMLRAQVEKVTLEKLMPVTLHAIQEFDKQYGKQGE